VKETLKSIAKTAAGVALGMMAAGLVSDLIAKIKAK
jgi:hypothetical protein